MEDIHNCDISHNATTNSDNFGFIHSAPISAPIIEQPLQVFNHVGVVDSGLAMANVKSEPYNPEKALWRAVILQSFSDACSRTTRTSEAIEREKSKSWLLGNSEGFRETCELACFDPDYIKREAIKAINSGYLMCEIAKFGAHEIKRRKDAIPDKIRRPRKFSKPPMVRKSAPINHSMLHGMVLKCSYQNHKN